MLKEMRLDAEGKNMPSNASELDPEIYWDYDEVFCFKCGLSEGCKCCFC